MSIIREAYEMYNIEKLNEVLKCKNLPSKEPDVLLKLLNKYSKKKKVNNRVKIKYHQKNNFGRFCCEGGVGLQFIQKDVRKYISGEYYCDIDIENCHPTLLNQITQMNGIYNEYLDKYVNNRNECLEEWKATKEEFLSMINYKNEPRNKMLKVVHESIYGTNKICKKLIKDNKQFFENVKKIAKNDFNYEGAFMAHYLQNVENDILVIISDYFNNHGFKVGVLMFDGLMVEKNENIENEFPKIEEEVFQKTGFKVKLSCKSMDTDWAPIVDEVVDETEVNPEGEEYKISKNKELYDDCFVEVGNSGKAFMIDREASERLVKYLNKFICKVTYPHAYGFRINVNELFELRPSEKVNDCIRYGFENRKNRDLSWKDSDNALRYKKFVFKIDEKKIKDDEYNLYKRPEMEEADDAEVLKLEFFNYLKTVLANNDEAIYFYLINYIAKMFQVGKTKQTIVLKGLMGTGKSSFCDSLSHIIGKEYLNMVKDINELTETFNALNERSILTQIEEVDANAGEYHKINNILKTLTTEEIIRIRKMNIDPYLVESHNNFILLTNRYNPIEITKDNRRVLVLRVSNIKLGDYNYFTKMINELKDNVKKVRYYFYKYKYEDNLNRIRPTTEAEMELLYLNMKSEDIFIQDKLVLNGDYDNDIREFQYVYEMYVNLCNKIKKKPLNQAYFSSALKQNGYDIIRIQKDRTRKRYIQGQTENIAEEED